MHGSAKRNKLYKVYYWNNGHICFTNARAFPTKSATSNWEKSVLVIGLDNPRVILDAPLPLLGRGRGYKQVSQIAQSSWVKVWIIVILWYIQLQNKWYNSKSHEFHSTLLEAHSHLQLTHYQGLVRCPCSSPNQAGSNFQHTSRHRWTGMRGGCEHEEEQGSLD